MELRPGREGDVAGFTAEEVSGEQQAADTFACGDCRSPLTAYRSRSSVSPLGLCAGPDTRLLLLQQLERMTTRRVGALIVGRRVRRPGEPLLEQVDRHRLLARVELQRP